MRRRDFIGLVGGAVAWPVAARAQPPQRVRRVAFIATTSPVSELIGPNPVNPTAKAFTQGLRELGYVDGQNLVIEWRSAEGKPDDLKKIVRQLVADHVDVIVAPVNPVTKAAKSVTTTVPIVMSGNAIPVEWGFVESLARPGGNITGLTTDSSSDISGKRIEIILELLPEFKRLGWLGPESHSSTRDFVAATARKLGLDLVLAETAPPNDHASAFASIAQADVQAMLVGGTAYNFVNRQLIVDFAARSHLPTMYHTRQFVDAGGLISYGADVVDIFRRAAGYVDLILKGAKPGELPVEEPKRYELVINLKTAKALGIKVPPSLLARADEVIE
jgi:putative ABC transport system substrate-binding protein